MPNYAAIAPIYRHGLRATESVAEGPPAPVEGVLDPQKRYNLDFTSAQVDPSTLTPEEIQGVIGETTRQPEWEGYMGQTDIDYLPDEDAELARITSKRQFLDDMKMTNELIPGSPEYLAFAEEAQATFRARNAKLNLEREKAENSFRDINRNPNLSAREKREMKVQYYDANPIWEAKKVQYPSRAEMRAATRPTFTKGYVQKVKGYLATNEGLMERREAYAYAGEKLGEDFETEYPDVVDIIDRREEADWEPLIGAEETAEPSIGESASKWWQPKQAESLKTPAKPKWLIGYPDAVWNPQLKAWTVFKGGNMVTLSEE